MTWYLREEPEALNVAVALVAESTGIPISHVEKDFWVTEILRAVADFAESESTTIVFKGGTSLSKAHRLIRRFSEDVDLIVVTPGDSRGAADRCLKGVVSAVDNAIGFAGLVDNRSATKGRKRTANYNYPGRHTVHGLRRGVATMLNRHAMLVITTTFGVCSRTR